MGRYRATLETPTETLRDSGATVTTAVGDAGDAPSLMWALRQLDPAYRVGVLVHKVAGFGGPPLQTDPDTLRRASELNLYSLVGAVDALLPQLQETSGTVLPPAGGLRWPPCQLSAPQRCKGHPRGWTPSSSTP